MLCYCPHHSTCSNSFPAVSHVTWSHVQIHTSKMSANSFLAADVDLWTLAQATKNFSGAEIEGLVKSATSFALNRQVDVADLTKPIEEENVKVRGGQPFICQTDHTPSNEWSGVC